MANRVPTTGVDMFHVPTPAWNHLVELEGELDRMLACQRAVSSATNGLEVALFPVIETLRPRLAEAWDAAQAEERKDIEAVWGAYPALLEGENPWRG